MEVQGFENRLLRADLVKVDWSAGGNDNFRTLEAVLEDISPMGACVQVEERIPPGTAVSISIISGEAARFSGWVAYCIYRDYGYFVGIRFSKETLWSSTVLEPQPADQTLSPSDLQH